MRSIYHRLSGNFILFIGNGSLVNNKLSSIKKSFFGYHNYIKYINFVIWHWIYQKLSKLVYM